MIGPDLLNDLFTNNIDFVHDQFKTIIDHLFPNGEDNADMPYTDQPILFTGQIKVKQATSDHGFIEGFTLYNVNFNPYSDSNALTPIGFPDDANSQFVSDFSQYLDNAYLYGNSSLIGLTTSNSNGIIHITDGSSDVLFDWGVYFNDIRAQHKRIQVTNEVHDTNGSLYWPYSYGTLDFNQVDGSKVFIVTDDRNSAQTIYNHINYNNDYHTSYVYNDNGADIYVGGGAGGLVVSPSVGFTYNQFKLALDSLIDDLNLNFANPDNKLPISEFPAYESDYEDQGSFYITPVKQLDTLPAAPDIADTVIDVSEPLDMLSYGFGSLLSVFDSLGVTLTLTFTFLACLVINKLRGD